MRVLLTGHQGYIGVLTAPLLAAAGHEVVGLDSGLFEDCDFGSQPPGPAGGSLTKDMRDLEPGDLAGFDAVVHLAALSNDPLGDLDPELTHAINYEATMRLARLAKEAGVRRFVFSSSCSNYGAASDEPLDEQAELNPITPYAVAKVEVERDLHALADDRFSPISMRNATAYGVSPRLRLDLALNNLVAHALLTGKVLLKSDGSAWRPFIHVHDIAAAMLAVLEAPRPAVHDETFNVGRTSENYRILDLAEIVVEAVPGSEIEFAPGAEPDKRSYRVDCGKIERLVPGFRPGWDCRRGAAELAAAFRREGLRRDQIEGARYVRLRRLQELLASGAVANDLRPRPVQPHAAG